jgi:hypothetical protein
MTTETTIPTDAVWETARQLAECKQQLAEARAALNEVQAWPYSETLETVRFIWKEKHAIALKAAQGEDDEYTAAIRAWPWG